MSPYLAFPTLMFFVPPLSRCVRTLKAASIGDLDKVFKDPEEFGRYLGVVGAEDQQEVLFICEVEQ
eukprot:520816-Amorphochlora_amoeboformis.AAC.1